MRLVGITLLGVTFIMMVEILGVDNTLSSSLSDNQPHSIIASICNNRGTNSDPVQRSIIDKIESNHVVYVKPIWHTMSFDWKRAAAGYIADCKVGGPARFFDSHSGQLLARWDGNGYVNYEH
jgi:hypothetical protein